MPGPSGSRPIQDITASSNSGSSRYTAGYTPRKAGHKRQFEKIQIQHHRHKGLANFGDGELDKMPVHCRTSVL